MANLHHSREQQSGQPTGFCALPSAGQSMCCVDPYVSSYVQANRSCSASLFQWDAEVGHGFLVHLHAFKPLTAGESQIFMLHLLHNSIFFFLAFLWSFCFSQGKKCWMWWEGLFAEYFQGHFTEAATFLVIHFSFCRNSNSSSFSF